MSKPNNLKRILIVLSIMFIPAISYYLLSRGTNQYNKLEIFGPREFSSTGNTDTLYHTIGNFNLFDQDSSNFTSENFKNKIVISNFFFASCQTICLDMSMQLKRVQEKYKNDPDVIITSYTVNPENDNVSILKKYANDYEAVSGKWYFLTGDKKIIYSLARHSYLVAVTEGDGEPDDFIHSEKLVLVDKERRIRGYYNGTDHEDVKKLLDEILVLKWEYENESVQ